MVIVHVYDTGLYTQRCYHRRLYLDAQLLLQIIPEAICPSHVGEMPVNSPNLHPLHGILQTL